MSAFGEGATCFSDVCVLGGLPVEVARGVRGVHLLT